MQDEHFMRQWNAGHARFSADADRGLVTLAAKAKRLPGWIGRKARLETALARKARLTTIAILAGVLAGSSLAAVTPLIAPTDGNQAPRQAAQPCTDPALA